jgi:hypothetical protein
MNYDTNDHGLLEPLALEEDGLGLRQTAKGKAENPNSLQPKTLRECRGMQWSKIRSLVASGASRGEVIAYLKEQGYDAKLGGQVDAWPSYIQATSAQGNLPRGSWRGSGRTGSDQMLGPPYRQGCA